MRNQKGITLIVLSIYIIAFTIVITLLANLSSYIYSNIHNISDSAIDLSEFNKFNMYFIDDIKNNNEALVNKNLTDENGNKYIQIAFADGDVYSYTIGDDSIYKNNQKIAKDIVNFNAELLENNKKKYIEISLRVGTNDKTNYAKTINYVLKYW